MCVNVFIFILQEIDDRKHAKLLDAITSIDGKKKYGFFPIEPFYKIELNLYSCYALLIYKGKYTLYILI